MRNFLEWTTSACCALVVLGCQPKEVAKAPPAAVDTVLELAPSDLATVRAGEIGLTLRINGTLRAIRQNSVRAKVAGEIVEVAVREGERVRAGQLLARIDRSEYLARLDDRRSSFEASRIQAAYAESTRRKNEELLQKKFISPQAYDNAKSGAEISTSQAQSLEAQVVLAKKALDDTAVRATIDGWVAERAVQRGDKTAVDGKLFTLVDLSRLELEALVPANEIARVGVGQAFTMVVEGYYGRHFQGRVARIGPLAVAGSRSVPIYIEVANPEAALKAGLFAEGTLSIGNHAAQALVPIAALRSESGASFVYLVAEGRIRRQPVEIGILNEAEGLAEITRGLAAGNTVVAANLGMLKDGLAVKAAASAPTAKP